MFGPNAACRDAPVSYQGISFRIRASLSRCRQIPESDAPLGAAHGRAKYFYIFFRQHAGFHLRIGHDVRGLTFCHQLAALRATQFIPEADHFLSHMFQIRENNNLVIIVYGSLIDDCFIAVVDARCRYKTPVHYDDEVIVLTYLKHVREKVIRFGYELRSAESGELVAEGETTHVVANSKMKPRVLPEKYIKEYRAAVGSP